MHKVIHDKQEHEAALARIETLIDASPLSSSEDIEELELLSLLVEDYEGRTLELTPPDPIEAIKFRMDQSGLTQRDLVPYLGSRSKVSEVLSGKRPLTMAMVRALHDGLGIPADVLIRPVRSDTADVELDWDKFPVKEMKARGWLSEGVDQREHGYDRLLQEFLLPLREIAPSVLYRRSEHQRSARAMDEYALVAWTARVVFAARSQNVPATYHPGAIDLDVMRELARLSWSELGPRLAVEFLAKRGVVVVIEPQLPRTYLDGATILVRPDQPIVGLTLRHDRIDNFWFTLMHELAHIALHSDSGICQYYDDLDVDDQGSNQEREADALAGEALIPESAWTTSPASRLKSPDAAVSLAKKLGIHPAIVAGRMRHFFRSYRLLTNLVGHGEVRKHFSESGWR